MKNHNLIITAISILILLLSLSSIGYADSNLVIIKDKSFKKGDITQDNKINLDDYNTLKKFINKTQEPTYDEKRLSDLDNDNKISNNDLQMLKDIIQNNANSVKEKGNGTVVNGITPTKGSVQPSGGIVKETSVIGSTIVTTATLVGVAAIVKNANQPATGSPAAATQATTPKTVTINTPNGPVTGTVNANGQVIGPNGNIIGTYSNGNVYSPTGQLIGSVNPTTGQIVNSQGNVVGTTTGTNTAQTVTWTSNGQTYTGTVGANGQIYNAQGQLIGTLGPGGTITMPNGTNVGTLNPNGTITNGTGQVIGTATTTTPTTTTGGTATAGNLTVSGITNNQTITSYAPITVTASTLGNTTATYSWVSSNPAVVSITAIATSGTKSVTLKPSQNGVATITVTDSAGNTMTISLSVSVQETISYTTASLVPSIYPGQPVTYQAVIKDIQGNTITGRQINYSVNINGQNLVNIIPNPTNNSVQLTSVGVGPIILTAQDQSNPNLTVNQAITCQGLKIDMGTVSLNPIISLNPITINPRITYTDGTTIQNPTISFALQDTTGKIATLSNPTIGANPSVVLQPVANGITQLIITVNNVPYSFPVNVSLNATVQITGPIYVKIPYTASYTANLMDTAGNKILNQLISWTTDNINISTIMAIATNTYNGILTPLNSGPVVITATNGTVKGLLPVAIIMPNISATNLLNTIKDTASVSSQITLSYVDGPADPTTLNFAYTNNNPAVASIIDLGNGQITIVPLTNGLLSFTVKITPKGPANLLNSIGISQTITANVSISEFIQITELDSASLTPIFNWGTPIFIKAPAKATIGAIVTDQVGNDITATRTPINFSTASGSTILAVASGPNNSTAIITPLNPGVTTVYATTKSGGRGQLQVTTMTPATTITTKATATQASINLNTNNYTQNSLAGYWVSANTVYSDGSPSGVTGYTWSVNDPTLATITPSTNPALPFDAFVQPLKNGSFSIKAVPTFSTFNNTLKLYGATTQSNIISATFVPVTTYLDNITSASGTFVTSASGTNIVNATTSLAINTIWVDPVSGLKTSDPVTPTYSMTGGTAWTGTPAGYNTTAFNANPLTLTVTPSMAGYSADAYSILSIAKPVTISAADKTIGGTLYSNLKVGDNLEITGSNLTPPANYIELVYIWSNGKKYRMGNTPVTVNAGGNVATLSNIPDRVIDEAASTSVIINKLLPPYTFSVKINGTNIESVPTSAYTAIGIPNAGIEVKSITNTNLNASVTANIISTVPNRFINFSVIPVGTTTTPNEKITLANRIITTNNTTLNQSAISGITPITSLLPQIPAQGTLNYSNSNPIVSFLTPTYSSATNNTGGSMYTNTSVGTWSLSGNLVTGAPKPFPADIIINTTSNNVFTNSTGMTYQAQNIEQIAYRATSSQNNQNYDAYANGGNNFNGSVPQGWSVFSIPNNSLAATVCGMGGANPCNTYYSAPYTFVIHRFNGSPLNQLPTRITGSNPLYSAAGIWDSINFFWTNPVYYGAGATIASIYSPVNGSIYTIGIGNISHKPASFIDSAGTPITITTTGIPTTNESKNGLLIPNGNKIEQYSLSTSGQQNPLYLFPTLPANESIESAYISGNYIYFLTYSTTVGSNTMSLYIADKLNPMNFAKIVPNLPINRPNDNTVVPAEYYPSLYVTNDIDSQYGYNTTNTRIYIIDIDGNLYQIIL